MKGFISLHRKLKNNPVWSDPNYLKLWIYCLFEASHSDREQLIGNEIVQLKRGQFMTGRNALSEEMNRGVKPKQRLSERTWFRYLDNLESWQMLSINKTNKYSVVTIDNYDTYQDVFNKVDQDSDQQLSNSCPTNDQQLSTNNNYNNSNNLNKLSSSTRDPNFAKVIQFYRSNLQVGVSPVPNNEVLLIDFFNEFGHEVLIAAMKVAAESEKKGVNFLGGVLRNWREAGVKTIDDARKYETEFREKQKRNYKSDYQPQSNEIIPDWFKERDEEQQEKQDDEQSNIVEMEEIINKYRKRG